MAAPLNGEIVRVGDGNHDAHDFCVGLRIRLRLDVEGSVKTNDVADNEAMQSLGDVEIGNCISTRWASSSCCALSTGITC